jgi:2-polyprenyl-3-methyl-5-hydroxy-6-metoxy-1,4-benzoquinol methylase
MTNTGTDFFEYDLYKAQISGSFLEKAYHNNRMREIANFVSRKEESILEYGCNTGAVLLNLLSKGFSVEGYDISKYNVERAKGYIQKKKYNSSVFYKDLPQKKWSCVLLVNVLEYVKNTDVLFENLSSHLTLDGSVVVVVANPWHPFIKFNSIRVLISKRSMGEINRSEPTVKIGSKEVTDLFLKNSFKLVGKKFGLDYLNTYLKFKR